MLRRFCLTYDFENEKNFFFIRFFEFLNIDLKIGFEYIFGVQRF